MDAKIDIQLKQLLTSGLPFSTNEYDPRSRVIQKKIWPIFLNPFTVKSLWDAVDPGLDCHRLEHHGRP